MNRDTLHLAGGSGLHEVPKGCGELRGSTEFAQRDAAHPVRGGLLNIILASAEVDGRFGASK